MPIVVPPGQPAITILDWKNRVEARLNTATVNVKVYDSEPEQDRTVREYVVLYPGGGSPSHEYLSRHTITIDWQCAIMCAGRTVDDTLDCAQQVRDALHGWDPAPEDPTVSIMIEDPVNAPILPYQSVEGDTRYSITPTYRLSHDR